MRARREEMKNTALELEHLRLQCPEDYGYVKGWIHCLTKKEAEHNEKVRGSAMADRK